MKLVERLMRWISGQREAANRDERINAQIEDNARDHSNIVGALHAAFSRRHERNDRLREAIRIARQRTSSFADFERMAIRKEELNRD